MVSVFPLGVMVTFAPADNATASFNPLRLFTTWLLAILAAVIVPSVMAALPMLPGAIALPGTAVSPAPEPLKLVATTVPLTFNAAPLGLLVLMPTPLVARIRN